MGQPYVLIDTAPHSESAARHFGPARHRSHGRHLRPGQGPRCGHVDAVPARGSLTEEAAEAIAGYHLTVAPVHIGQRMTFVHSLTANQTALEYEPQGRAAPRDQRALQVDMPTVKHAYIYTSIQVKVKS